MKSIDDAHLADVWLSSLQAQGHMERVAMVLSLQKSLQTAVKGGHSSSMSLRNRKCVKVVLSLREQTQSEA